jgi:hypothetical protein
LNTSIKQGLFATTKISETLLKFGFTATAPEDLLIGRSGFVRSSMTNEIGSMTRGTKSVAIVTAILGALIAALSLYYFFSSAAISGGVIDKDRAAAAKEIFDDVVIKTLVPIFNTLIAAILAWVFGKPLVASLAERLRP